GGGGKITLGEPVDAVIFNDVNQGQVAAQQVHELADTDGRRVAVAGDANAHHVAVRQDSAGGNGRHATVNGVEAVRESQEVGRRFRRATDARKFRDLPGIHA